MQKFVSKKVLLQFIAGNPQLNILPKIKTLGSGSFGDVYEVQFDKKKSNQRAPEAVKIMLVDKENFTIDETVRELYISTIVAPRNRFLVSASSIHLHTFVADKKSNIEKIWNNFAFLLIFMPKVRQGDFEKFIDFKLMRYTMFNAKGIPSFLTQPKKLEVLVRLFTQALCGLRSLHSIGLVHMDLKPDNIFIDGSDALHSEARLADFGLSLWGESALNRDSNYLLIPMYRPPEMRDSETGFPFIKSTADMWVMGLMFMQMIYTWMIRKRDYGKRIPSSKFWEDGNLFNYPPKSWKSSIAAMQENKISPQKFMGLIMESNVEAEIALERFTATCPELKSVWPLIKFAIRHDPAARPTAAQFIDKILEVFPQLKIDCVDELYEARKSLEDATFTLEEKKGYPPEFDVVIKQLEDTLLNKWSRDDLNMERDHPSSAVLDVQFRCILKSYLRLSHILGGDHRAFTKQNKTLFLLSAYLHWGSPVEYILTWKSMNLKTETSGSKLKSVEEELEILEKILARLQKNTEFDGVPEEVVYGKRKSQSETLKRKRDFLEPLTKVVLRRSNRLKK